MASAPVLPHQRIHFLDVLRGFAISGVLVAYVFWNLGNAPATTYTSFDIILDEAVFFLIDSKCYTLLASLFAVGFVLHMNKSDNPARSLYIYRRRLIGLLIIGLLHAFLLRNGDILVPYALLMLLVSFLNSSSNRTIIIIMIMTFFLQIVLPEAWKALHLSFPQRPEANGSSYWLDNLAYVKYWYASAIFLWEGILFLLLGGLLLGRFFIQNKIRLSIRQLRSIAVIGFLAGTSSYLILKFYSNELSGLPDVGSTHIGRGTLNNLLWLIHKVGLASTYASIFFLLSKHFQFITLANPGRMSLSNYILQAMIVIPICLTFNLFDQITPSIALVMASSIWLIQVLFSWWWLKYHRFGPLEWALRRFTYGKSVAPKNKRKKWN